jgi:hypothetical protein
MRACLHLAVVGLLSNGRFAPAAAIPTDRSSSGHPQKASSKHRYGTTASRHNRSFPQRTRLTTLRHSCQPASVPPPHHGGADRSHARSASGSKSKVTSRSDRAPAARRVRGAMADYPALARTLSTTITRNHALKWLRSPPPPSQPDRWRSQVAGRCGWCVHECP